MPAARRPHPAPLQRPFSAHRIAAVRRFNRFYTRKIGVLQEGLLDSPFSLTEARVLYELAQCGVTTASALGAALGLDAGYLSRILRGFGRRGLIAKTRSAADGRSSDLVLTARGRNAFAPLDARSSDAVGKMLEPLTAAAQAQLVAAMRGIERLLDDQPADSPAPYVLRLHQPGDLGWIVHRHGVLYAEEHGWHDGLEAIAAEVAAAFLRQHDSKRERCWIAERDGDILGSVLLVAQSPTVAQLRLLLVEPRARGMGIGRRLVEECIRFARHGGYRTLTLWTNDVLVAARQLYESLGFRLTREEPHDHFGRPAVGQTFVLDLDAG